MTDANVPLWTPSEAFTTSSNMYRFASFLRDKSGINCKGYHQLWQWSVDHPAEFWAHIWQYFDIQSSQPYQRVLKPGDEQIFGATWFEGTEVNYAEHIFRKKQHGTPAIVFKSETHPLTAITWDELENNVARLANHFRNTGLVKGDVVVSFLPNIPEAIIAFLAANSLGLIWSGCSPDFGAPSVLDRFRQVEPKVLLVADGYSYNGKYFDRTAANRVIAEGLPSLQEVIFIPFIDKNSETKLPNSVTWEHALSQYIPLTFTRVPFNHPIWVMYSSGTTGKPKAITHGTGGILLEHLKAMSLHQDVKPGERFFWYSTTGWMMWNYANAALLCGATVAVYEGASAWPDIRVLWQFAKEAGVHHFGAGAAFYLACMKAGLQKEDFQGLDQLRAIGYTGSPLPAEGWEWIYNTVKKEVWLQSLSGGTDICSGFVGGNPYDPVYAGETQCRMLGCKLEAFDDNGQPLYGEVGEMVITAPMPSMPVFFWGDECRAKYHASYFEHFPGVWRHGDWVKVSDRGTITIYGRSDATLNRGGVRIGTSEVYSAVESVPEVLDSLVLSIEMGGGDYYMPLFVVLRKGLALTDELKKKINTQLRTLHSPRHVPDEIIQAPEIPYTISGKKMETPIKKILMGKKVEEVMSRDAMRNPDAIAFFGKLGSAGR
jgi:acetoacetyl-CoA synthetase